MCPHPRDDVGDITGSAEVGAEARAPEVDDVRVRVIETGQYRGAAEGDDPGLRPAKTHHLRPAGGQHATGRDRQVRVRAQPGTAEGPDSPAGEDELSAQSPIE